MSAISVADGVSVNKDRTLNFGNHLSTEKIKVKDFEISGNLYSVKTHNEVTRLEKDDKFLLECVPGASFFNFSADENEIGCSAYGAGVTNITIELAPETEYTLTADGTGRGVMKSNKSGKISFSVELSGKETELHIRRVNG